jgi:hypothetical protein
MHRTMLATLLAAALLGSAACDNDVENATEPPPPAPTTTDEFTGTLTVNGAQVHTFNVVASGTVTATLTELVTSDSSITVGLTLGSLNAVLQCTAVIADNNAVQGRAVIGNVTGAGTLCVRIHDVGKLTGSQDYKLTVVHP